MLTTLYSVLKNRSISLVGGTGDAGKISANGKVYKDAVAYALVRNQSGRVKAYKENIYHQMENYQFIASQTDKSKYIIGALNGRPAKQVYQDILKVTEIEAARAGEQGKGFAVVAVEVKKLADEIKGLTKEVGSGIQEVEQGTDQLNSRINISQDALEESLNKVQETYDMFDEITRAAEGATTVHTGISDVIDQSKSRLQILCGFFDQIKNQYQEVVKHINKAARLGTTKSAMLRTWII